MPAGPQSRPRCQPLDQFGGRIRASTEATTSRPNPSSLRHHASARTVGRPRERPLTRDPTSGSACSCVSARRTVRGAVGGVDDARRCSNRRGRSRTRAEAAPDGSEPRLTDRFVVAACDHACDSLPSAVGDHDAGPVPRHVRRVPLVPAEQTRRRATSRGPTRSRRCETIAGPGRRAEPPRSRRRRRSRRRTRRQSQASTPPAPRLDRVRRRPVHEYRCRRERTTRSGPSPPTTRAGRRRPRLGAAARARHAGTPLTTTGRRRAVRGADNEIGRRPVGGHPGQRPATGRPTRLGDGPAARSRRSVPGCEPGSIRATKPRPKSPSTLARS